jgi:hypothetical protein
MGFNFLFLLAHKEDLLSRALLAVHPDCLATADIYIAPVLPFCIEDSLLVNPISAAAACLKCNGDWQATAWSFIHKSLYLTACVASFSKHP